MRNRKGLSLLEVLVGLAVLGILSIAILEIQRVSMNIFNSNKLFVTRSTIRSSIERYISDFSIVSKSSKYRVANSDGNEMLDYCLNGPPIAPTTLCPAANFPNCCVRATDPNPQSFYLLDPASSVGAKFSGTTATSSPTTPATNISDPVYYNTDGATCLIPGDNCPLELQTWYLADCPASAIRCQKANQVLIRYDLKRAPGSFSLASFKNSTNTIQISATASASSGSLSWAGYTPAVAGDFGRVKGANQLCAAAYSGSHWASWNEIAQLGSDYPYSQIAWIRDVVASFDLNNTTYILRDGTSCGATFGQAPNQCLCNNWGANFVAFRGVAIELNGSLAQHTCDQSLALPCVR